MTDPPRIGAHIEINGQNFQFHIEGSDQEDITKPCGLRGVLQEQTGMTVKGPNDATTWAKIEAFVRFASKP